LSTEGTRNKGGSEANGGLTRGAGLICLIERRCVVLVVRDVCIDDGGNDLEVCAVEGASVQLFTKVS